MHPERRREVRFPLRQPARVQFRDNNSQQITAIADNASLHGLLICTEQPLPEYLQVNITLTLSNSNASAVIPLHASGTIVRIEQRFGRPAAAIACDAPLEEATAENAASRNE